MKTAMKEELKFWLSTVLFVTKEEKTEGNNFNVFHSFQFSILLLFISDQLIQDRFNFRWICSLTIMKEDAHC